MVEFVIDLYILKNTSRPHNDITNVNKLPTFIVNTQWYD